ncbi:hypothetical protein [Dyadobacter frigoris]|uniref:DUF3575 domain-containing protein n=1 Tax=Dyadobacter frigoris TaxID=2576211 RepID=A0A4U6CRX5_9BACT|nr:hypothetical protein [Dyadobacter frigoris]TKT86241.1 hypothetical protein FDK13_32530 [Dyadobacter frigoris]GLU56917.1 hypothetical protein Dfri01_63780 [Dyadobacter frigoris]
MKNYFLLLLMLFFAIFNVSAQNDTSAGTFWHPNPAVYTVKHALEVESLVPMFFTGGYHFALGYRYKKFRIRASVINGGTYNAETAGLKNSSADFKRYYTTSPGVFFGYNVWKNLEVYSYLEFHTFKITQKSTDMKKDLKSVDTGLGISYQFFIGKYFYVQPGLHLYLRRNNSVDFGEATYNIPNADVSPVIRIGARLWKKY